MKKIINELIENLVESESAEELEEIKESIIETNDNEASNITVRSKPINLVNIRSFFLSIQLF